ncbi:MAG: GH3 auxin-responsive promoter family protein [Opitutaceae bacterium]|nr:GH3 auxin-responsive promoter family protein [Opitutaceae bacterium]
MLRPPNSLVSIVAGHMARRLSGRLRKLGNGVQAQQAAFQQLSACLAHTAFGRDAGIETGLTYEQFRTRVAPQTYGQLRPYIDRMKRGEADVLWPGHCTIFGVSSGTTDESPKQLPVTDAMLGHFHRAGRDSLLLYVMRAGHAGVYLGRQLLVGGTTALVPVDSDATTGAYAGNLSGIATLNLPGWARQHLYEPGHAIAQMTDWPAKLQAMAERTCHADITLLAGIPNWILEFAEVILARARQGSDHYPTLQSLWPNLECLVHGGVPLGPFQDRLRSLAGPEVNFHEIYPSVEGFIAAQDDEASLGLRLLVDAGLFFEFLPMQDFDEDNLANLGDRTVPIEGVRPGVDYVLLLTTPAGLCRYALGDIVHFVSTHPPRLIYAGRTKLQLNAFGEHVIEKELTDALLAVCQGNGWQMVNFHAAPLFSTPALQQARGAHEWWIELQPGTMRTPTGPLLAIDLDRELAARNDNYATKRQSGALRPPEVRLVMPGVFEKWMKENDRWGSQNIMPRCRCDRQIADQLAALTRFASGTPNP